jgi:thioredoxin reductase
MTQDTAGGQPGTLSGDAGDAIAEELRSPIRVAIIDIAEPLRDRVEGVVDALTSTRVRAAAAQGSGVRLTLDGSVKTLDVDHVIAGTGFHVDVAQLPFLSQDLLARIRSAKGYPALSRVGESSVPGLYFAGAMAAGALGPSERFIAGTHNVAAMLAKSVARRARGGIGRSTPVAVAPGVR